MDDGDVRGAVRVWRVPPSARIFALAVFVLFVAVAGLLTAFGITFIGALGVWLITIAVMVFVWRWYLVPYVALTPDRLVVQGPFTHRSLRYGEITGACPGVLGLQIETTSEGDFSAWAIQKSKLSEWLHRGTTADDVAAEIMERVQRTTASASASQSESESESATRMRP